MYLDSQRTHWIVGKHQSRDDLGSYIEWIDFAERYQIIRMPPKRQIWLRSPGDCCHVQELCGLHDTVLMIVIPTHFVSIHCGYHNTFFSMDRSSSSLATLLQRQISPTGRTQSLHSKRYLISHLVRERQPNA